MFLVDLVNNKKPEAIHFRNKFHDKLAQNDWSKEMLVPILKGLKHLNAVLGSHNSGVTLESSKYSRFNIESFPYMSTQ